MASSEKAEILAGNQQAYEQLYKAKQAYLRYPADWIIRFHNMYLRDHLPTGRVLDYGCGAGNNAMFFLMEGYEVHGVEVNEAARPLIRENLRKYHLDESFADRVTIVPPDNDSLPFEDEYFDFILSNQVLYYLPSEDDIRRVTRELARCLRKDGIVFFSVIGPKNYYIRYHTKRVLEGGVHEMIMDAPGHRLEGLRELFFLTRSEEHLKDIFSEFNCVTTGYFDQAMFDMKSNFHWIFVGRKP